MVTIDDVIKEIQKNNRVCPQPKRWQELYDLLPNKQRKISGCEPALPLILAALWDTPAQIKIMRLREHIDWAAAQGCLEKVYDFLCKLPENDWHHVGE